MVPRLRECWRQSQAEVASKSSNKIHQTWGLPFSWPLYKSWILPKSKPAVSCTRMTVAETEDRKAAILTENRESHSSIIIRSFDHSAHRGSLQQGRMVKMSKHMGLAPFGFATKVACIKACEGRTLSSFCQTFRLTNYHQEIVLQIRQWDYSTQMLASREKPLLWELISRIIRSFSAVAALKLGCIVCAYIQGMEDGSLTWVGIWKIQI